MALKLCPQAKVIKGDMERYSQLSHTVTGNSRKNRLLPKSEYRRILFRYHWYGSFYGCYQWTNELAQRVVKETGLPISFALSINKTVSKIGTGEGKPRTFRHS
jgi:DNA polymerase-4